MKEYSRIFINQWKNKSQTRSTVNSNRISKIKVTSNQIAEKQYIKRKHIKVVKTK